MNSVGKDIERWIVDELKKGMYGLTIPVKGYTYSYKFIKKCAYNAAYVYNKIYGVPIKEVNVTKCGKCDNYHIDYVLEPIMIIE
jgi:hypothetical protein